MLETRLEEELNAELRERVRELLGCGEYARAYMEHVLDPRRPRPKKPSTMTGLAAVMVRDTVEDVAAAMAATLPPVDWEDAA